VDPPQYWASTLEKRLSGPTFPYASGKHLGDLSRQIVWGMAIILANHPSFLDKLRV